MEMILAIIEDALRAGSYYVAVAVTLTLPGICAALQLTTGATSGQDAFL